MTRFGHIDEPTTREEALCVLRDGGVAVLPTDTLYGLSAAASSTRAILHIRAIKRSRDERLFIVLASSLDMVDAHVRSFGCASRELLESVWPAPVTAILPLGPRRAEWMGDTVAVRVPDLPPLLELIDALGEPIVSTSVNREGEAPRRRLAAIAAAFGDEVDLLVEGHEERMKGTASTIVDLTGDAPVVIRQGDFRWPATR